MAPFLLLGVLLSQTPGDEATAMGEASKLTPSGADVTDPVSRLRLSGARSSFPEARAKRLDNSRTEDEQALPERNGGQGRD
jgi:hypothetical protein